MSEVLTGEVVDDGNESHLTLELVEKAIWLSRGNRARAARRLGITRQAVNGWQIRHPHLRTLAAEARELAESGFTRPGDVVVAVLTGHVLKDPGILLDYHRDREPAPPGANRPVEIDASLGALERVLSAGA